MQRYEGRERGKRESALGALFAEELSLVTQHEQGVLSVLLRGIKNGEEHPRSTLLFTKSIGHTDEDIGCDRGLEGPLRRQAPAQPRGGSSRNIAHLVCAQLLNSFFPPIFRAPLLLRQGQSRREGRGDKFTTAAVQATGNGKSSSEGRSALTARGRG